jgi:hypothetical protein
VCDLSLKQKFFGDVSSIFAGKARLIGSKLGKFLKLAEANYPLINRQIGGFGLNLSVRTISYIFFELVVWPKHTGEVRKADN